MNFQLVCVEKIELTQYKSDMQETFQKGFEDTFGKTDAVILPEKDIDQSLKAEGPLSTKLLSMEKWWVVLLLLMRVHSITFLTCYL